MLLISGLLKLRGKLQMASLREAIHDADKLHQETGRKHLVVYDQAEQEFIPVAKRALKDQHKKRKLTKGKAGMKLGRVKQIEKKSVYAT